MESLISKKNYIGTKFFVQSPKMLKAELLTKKGVFSSFISNLLAKDSMIKTYYDTPDSYFFQKGISINITRFKGKDAELVVRYSSKAPRIAFLQNIPDTFVKTVNKKDYIENHLKFVEDAVQELIPSGFDEDISIICKNIKPQITVSKKRERYRLFNVAGLKLILSIDEAEYSSYYNSQKHKTTMCESILLSGQNTADMFSDFEHQLAMQIPSIVQLAENDLSIAQEYIGTNKKAQE